MNALPLRPLGTGELLDRALTVYRANFRELFKIAFALELTQRALTKTFDLVAYAKFPLMTQPRALANDASLDEAMAQLRWGLPTMLLYLGASLLLWQLSIAAVSLTPAEATFAQPVRAIDAWRRLVPRLPRVLPTLVLELLVIAFNVALGAIPAAVGVFLATSDIGKLGLILAFVGLVLSAVMMLGLFLVAMLRYVLVPPVAIVEGRWGFAALGRAGRLMRGRSTESLWQYPKIRGSFLLLVVGLATNAVMLVASAPRSLVLLSDATASQTSPFMLAAEALEVAAASAIAPFGMVALALFYLDLRARREGVDLDVAIDALAKAA